MICPICQYENLQGVDNCENCGADLRTVDIPRPGTELEARLVEERLGALEPTVPLTVSADTGVAQVIASMQEAGAEAVLVLDGDALAGIFTERDVLLKLAGRPLDDTPVREVMTPDPVVLRDQDSVAVAIHKMAVGGFRHIPLVDGGRPTGIVSSGDLFRHIGRILA